MSEGYETNEERVLKRVNDEREKEAKTKLESQIKKKNTGTYSFPSLDLNGLLELGHFLHALFQRLLEVGQVRCGRTGARGGTVLWCGSLRGVGTGFGNQHVRVGCHEIM